MEYKDTYLQPTPYGKVTAVDHEDIVWVKANDYAKLLLFRNPREAVKNYCREAKFFKVKTNGGIQPTKFINYLDRFRLQIKSNHPDAESKLMEEYDELIEDQIVGESTYEDFMEAYNETLELREEIDEFEEAFLKIAKINKALFEQSSRILEVLKSISD